MRSVCPCAELFVQDSQASFQLDPFHTDAYSHTVQLCLTGVGCLEFPDGSWFATELERKKKMKWKDTCKSSRAGRVLPPCHRASSTEQRATLSLPQNIPTTTSSATKKQKAPSECPQLSGHPQSGTELVMDPLT